jgi:hypothetical protein
MRVPTISERKTRSVSRLACYVHLGYSGADDSEPEGSPPPLTVLTRHLSRDLLARGCPRQLIAAVDSLVWQCVDIRACMPQGSQATQESSGSASKTKSFQLCLARLPRPLVLKAFSAEDLATTDKVKNFLQAGPIGPGGGRKLPAAQPWSYLY